MSDKSKRENIGLIVEEVAEVDERMVKFGPKLKHSNGELVRDTTVEEPVPYRWEPREVVPVLIKAIQELNQKVKDLEDKVNA